MATGISTRAAKRAHSYIESENGVDKEMTDAGIVNYIK